MLCWDFNRTPKKADHNTWSKFGHELATDGIQIGEWLLFEALFDDPEGEMWLASCRVPCSPWSMFNQATRACFKFQTRFDKGDFMIATQFFERTVDSIMKRGAPFILGETNIDVLNSTELRARGLTIDLLPSPRLSRRHSDEEKQAWLSPRTIEAEAQLRCR